MNIVRNTRTLVVLLLLIILGVSTLSAQRASSLRISEVMTQNKTSIVDEYGHNSSWVEIYNSSSATVDLKGCYITDDKDNLKKHRIPMWSTDTKLGPRQYMILWLDGDANKGVLHTNFSLKPNENNFLALIDADGKSIISVVSVPVIPVDHSYKASNIVESSEKNIDTEWIISSNPSPIEPNEEIKTSSKVENLEEMDPTGIIMTITAVAVVFIALLTLAIVFTFIGKAMRPRKKTKNSALNANKSEVEVAISIALSQYMSSNDEHIVAISMALNQAKAISHEDQNMRLTIKRKSTQWNDRSYGLRKYDY